jgi:hypothetical protein
MRMQPSIAEVKAVLTHAPATRAQAGRRVAYECVDDAGTSSSSPLQEAEGTR